MDGSQRRSSTSIGARLPLFLLVAAGVLVLLGSPGKTGAQESLPASTAESLSENPPDAPAYAGGKPMERRLYFGMATVHFRELDRGFDNNWLIGVSWGRVYGATFINSFGNRGYSAGVQGAFTRRETGPVSLGLGYRAGLITGYDERFIPLAGKTPVLPLLQPLLTVDRRKLGLELSYSGVVASAAVSARF